MLAVLRIILKSKKKLSIFYFSETRQLKYLKTIAHLLYVHIDLLVDFKKKIVISWLLFGRIPNQISVHYSTPPVFIDPPPPLFDSRLVSSIGAAVVCRLPLFIIVKLKSFEIDISIKESYWTHWLPRIEVQYVRVNVYVTFRTFFYSIRQQLVYPITVYFVFLFPVVASHACRWNQAYCTFSDQYLIN